MAVPDALAEDDWNHEDEFHEAQLHILDQVEELMLERYEADQRAQHSEQREQQAEQRVQQAKQRVQQAEQRTQLAEQNAQWQKELNDKLFADTKKIFDDNKKIFDASQREEQKIWEKNLELGNQNWGLKQQLNSLYFAAIMLGVVLAFGAFIYFVQHLNLT